MGAWAAERGTLDTHAHSYRFPSDVQPTRLVRTLAAAVLDACRRTRLMRHENVRNRTGGDHKEGFGVACGVRTFSTSCRGKKAAKNMSMHVASMRARNGKMMKYLRKVPRTHVGNRYQFQFQGSGGADVKHRKNESSIKELAASHNRSDVSNKVALHVPLSVDLSVRQVLGECLTTGVVYMQETGS